MGIFAFLTGNPGATKSLVTLEFAARLTRGKMPGDLEGQPVKVLYVSVEGGHGRSIGPRFDAAGGDFAFFEHIEEVIMLPSNKDRLEALIKHHQARLVIIDPIKDHFDPNVYASPTRSAHCLGQLLDLAEKYNCTILGVDWPSKSARKGDLSVSGNQAMTGKPRQTLAVGRLSRDEWVVGVTKANDSAAYTGWIYSVEDVDLGPDEHGTPVRARRILWRRPAQPSDVMRAHEQAKIEEDPNLRALLQYMEGGAPFTTDDLVVFLNQALLMGKNKARDMVNAAHGAGYLTQARTGKGADFKVTWAISPIGTLKLSADEESVEAAIETLFPPMDVPSMPQRLALPSGSNGTPVEPKRPMKRLKLASKKATKAANSDV